MMNAKENVFVLLKCSLSKVVQHTPVKIYINKLKEICLYVHRYTDKLLGQTYSKNV